MWRPGSAGGMRREMAPPGRRDVADIGAGSADVRWGRGPGEVQAWAWAWEPGVGVGFGGGWKRRTTPCDAGLGRKGLGGTQGGRAIRML